MNIVIFMVWSWNNKNIGPLDIDSFVSDISNPIVSYLFKFIKLDYKILVDDWSYIPGFIKGISISEVSIKNGDTIFSDTQFVTFWSDQINLCHSDMFSFSDESAIYSQTSVEIRQDVHDFHVHT